MKGYFSKKFLSKILVFCLTVSFFPVQYGAGAGKIVLNKTSCSLTVGKSMTLRLKNSKKKVKWSVLAGKSSVRLSNKKKTSVEVTACKKGSVKIRAKAGGKKYICNVTVKAKKKKDRKSTASPKPVSVESVIPATDVDVRIDDTVETEADAVASVSPVVTVSETPDRSVDTGDLEKQEAAKADETAVPVSEPSVIPSPSTTPGATPKPVAVPVVVSVPVVMPAGTPKSVVTAAPTVTPVPAVTAAPAATPVPTATPEPTVTPDSEKDKSDEEKAFLEIQKQVRDANTQILVNGTMTTLEEKAIWEDGHLVALDVKQIELDTLDVRAFPKLERLECGGTYEEKSGGLNRKRLKELDVSQNLELKYLDCSYNELERLDISKNLKLEYLDLSGNLVKELDLTLNRNLQYLNCCENEIECLDLRNQSLLQEYIDISVRVIRADAAEEEEIVDDGIPEDDEEEVLEDDEEEVLEDDEEEVLEDDEEEILEDDEEEVLED